MDEQVDLFGVEDGAEGADELTDDELTDGVSEPFDAGTDPATAEGGDDAGVPDEDDGGDDARLFDYFAVDIRDVWDALAGSGDDDGAWADGSGGESWIGSDWAGGDGGWEDGGSWLDSGDDWGGDESWISGGGDWSDTYDAWADMNASHEAYVWASNMSAMQHATNMEIIDNMDGYDDYEYTYEYTYDW